MRSSSSLWPLLVRNRKVVMSGFELSVAKAGDWYVAPEITPSTVVMSGVPMRLVVSKVSVPVAEVVSANMTFSNANVMTSARAAVAPPSRNSVHAATRDSAFMA